ncbi:putative hemolysin [Vibrio hippocampi]|uniref:DUF333 domain-containing protein n=1 Tax=Vibrio hippocampi TaxID=654686 RepID=A0ABN8DHJ5_9VIBR|nr:DUF333 domain-containing protein [Vibrio hippocampi]CAH0525837.1 hypothetical protein VHP8226_01359 [Vibrio hippocampi]
MQFSLFKGMKTWGLFVTVFMVAACSEQAEDTNKLDMANPAAVFCEEQGEYDLKTGQCKLKSGEVVDAWEFFRQHNQ